MGDKLERIYEYRVLRGKRDSLGLQLSSAEQARLMRLENSLPTGIPTADDRNPYTLLTTPLPARLTVGGQLVQGVLRNVSADGLAIVLDPPPPLNQTGLVHVSESLHGIEYHFPGRIVARVVKGLTSVGIAFEGVPSQMRLGSRRSGVWRQDEAVDARAESGLRGTSKTPMEFPSAQTKSR